MDSIQQITVFGASGNIGTEIIKLLSGAGISTKAVSRQKHKITNLPHMDWVYGDMALRESLYEAMRNSTSVFLLSGYSPDFVNEQKNVIDVANEIGIQHIVKLSSGASDENSAFYIPRTHGEVESHLMRSGMDWTMIRPNGIMQNWLGELAEQVRTEGKFTEAAGNGTRAHVDRRDIADVAFHCLKNREYHANKIYLLTSDCAVSYYDIANAISQAIGKNVIYKPITSEEARKGMINKGLPQALIDTFISYDEAQANGQTGIVTKVVRNILKRPARTMEGFFKEFRLDFM